MSEQRQQEPSAQDALEVAVGTARLAGWIGLAAGMGTCVYAAVGQGEHSAWWGVGLVVLCFGVTWGLVARVGGALGAMVRR